MVKKKKLLIETWVSDKGGNELQHFLEDQRTYVFGINRALLGNKVYQKILKMIKKELKQLKNKTSEKTK
jgi:hypothetical protein